MTRMTGYVSPKGESATGSMPGQPGVFDMIEAGNDLKLSDELEEQIRKLVGTQDPKAEARFLLEVIFNEDRSVHRPFGGFLMAWTNGGFAHGGGDEKVYFCPNKVEKNGHTKICAAPLAPNLVKHNIGICVACKQPSQSKRFVGEVYFRLPVQHWATVLTRYYARLDCNADLKITMMRGDFRVASEKEQEKAMHGDLLDDLRSKRGSLRYSLRSIIQDTANGATLETVFNAFLRA